MNTEPAVTIGAVTTLIAAAIALLVAFGVDITEDQTKAILAFVAAAGPLASALLIRRKVTPTT
jgi:ABC-type spermidine/putrescine transport system permease subunit I